ncbi:glycoside hydrolase family 92 protein, partial [Diplogelasinospora grovesii]
MGELGQIVLSPGMGDVRPLFQDRGLAFRKSDEMSTAYVYEVLLDAAPTGTQNWNLTEEAAGGGPVPGGAGSVPDTVEEGANGRTRKRSAEIQHAIRDDHAPKVYGRAENATDGYNHAIQVAMTASPHVGYLRLDFLDNTGENQLGPYVLIQATRVNYTGQINIDPERMEISGSNPQLLDYLLGPDHPNSFKGYFVSRFSVPFSSYGVSFGGNMSQGQAQGGGKNLGAYVKFDKTVQRVEVRTGVSFVSVEQARKNIDLEIPDGVTFDAAVNSLKSAWLEKLGRITIEGFNKTDAAHDPRTIFYTGLFHALQYPSDFSEPTGNGSLRTFYSGYTDSVHEANDSYYQSWSLWDTYRAEHSLLTLFAPERVNSMMRTLLRIFDWTGRLPMWANLKETNIMIGTNADVVLANALQRGFRGFNLTKAWQAVWKDAYIPPDNDTQLLYYDREPNTPYEVRAGLTAYMDHGWVDNDRWSESASRTLDYAFEDYAASIVAQHANGNLTAAALFNRSQNYVKLWDSETQFMHARNSNGTFTRDDEWGWTEGDKWVYTFNVMHDPAGLATLFNGGREGMMTKLDQHFDGGHNLHSNEPAHHVPYLYATIGYPGNTAERVREVAYDNYNATSAGLSGNEDLGQMSAWYVFSALGFYPVNPASDEYVVGSPFFEKVTLRFHPAATTGGNAVEHGEKGERTLTITAPGAPTSPYVKSLKVDGRDVTGAPVLRHKDIVTAQRIEFEMSDEPTTWGTQGLTPLFTV